MNALVRPRVVEMAACQADLLAGERLGGALDLTIRRRAR